MIVRLALALLLLPVSLVASPSDRPHDSAVLSNLLDRFEKAYLEKCLAQFDSQPLRPVMVVIENSISGESVFKSFQSFKEFDNWLVSQEIEGFPRREVRKRFRPRNGFAVYDNQGIQHNTLYLNQVNWSFTNNGPIITKVFLYDGK